MLGNIFSKKGRVTEIPVNTSENSQKKKGKWGKRLTALLGILLIISVISVAALHFLAQDNPPDPTANRQKDIDITPDFDPEPGTQEDESSDLVGFLGDSQEQSSPEKEEAPANDPTERSNKSTQQTDPTSQPNQLSSERTNMTEELEYEELQSEIDDMKEELGEKITELTKLTELTRENQAETKKLIQGILEKEPEEDQDKSESIISDLKARIKDLEGKYEWVRELERQKSKEVALLQQENAKLRQHALSRPLFPEWNVVGLSSDKVVFKNKETEASREVSVGEVFRGVRIEKINVQKGEIETSGGIYTREQG